MTSTGRPADPTGPDISAVVLTMGNRPDQLSAALASILRQRGVTTECIVVVNGPATVDVPEGVRRIDLADNVGVPAGRNVGAAAATGRIVAFVDDDAELRGDDVLAVTAARFDRSPDLAVVGWRLVDEQGETAARHIPRPGRRGADVAGPVAGFLGGACAIRAAAFQAVGGYPDGFVFAMEETDLMWRLVDAGWSLWYEPRCVLFHPRSVPSRQATVLERTARNRAWAAHRNLPLPIAVIHLALWTAITGARNGRAALRTTAVTGWRAWRAPLGPRRPMRWRTVARLTRLGRPPLI